MQDLFTLRKKIWKEFFLNLSLSHSFWQGSQSLLSTNGYPLPSKRHDVYDLPFTVINYSDLRCYIYLQGGYHVEHLHGKGSPIFHEVWFAFAEKVVDLVRTQKPGKLRSFGFTEWNCRFSSFYHVLTSADRFSRRSSGKKSKGIFRSTYNLVITWDQRPRACGAVSAWRN